MTGNPLLVLVGISVIGWLLAGPAAGQGDASGEEVRRERKITVMPKSVTYKKAAEDKHLYTVAGIYQTSVEQKLELPDVRSNYRFLMPECTGVELDFANRRCVFTTSRALALPELADAMDEMAELGGDLPYWAELEARDLPEGGVLPLPYTLSATNAAPPAGLAWLHANDDREFRMPIGQVGDHGTLLIVPSTAFCMCHSRYVIRILDPEGKVAWKDTVTAFAGVRIALADAEGFGRHEIWLKRDNHGEKEKFLIR